MKTASESKFFIVKETSAKERNVKRDAVTHNMLIKAFLETLHQKETNAKIKDFEDDTSQQYLIHSSQCMKINRNKRYK